MCELRLRGTAKPPSKASAEPASIKASVYALHFKLGSYQSPQQQLCAPIAAFTSDLAALVFLHPLVID